MQQRFIATFTPQAWMNDHAIQVDPQGPRHWDVTEQVMATPEAERSQLLEADTDVSDSLRYLDNAPAWVRDWSGPFYVSVEEMDEAKASLLLGESAPAPDALGALLALIPDSDGKYGRGYRDALQSIALALGPNVPPQVLASAVITATDAYGNNVERAGHVEIAEVLVLSTAHLSAAEREAIARGELPPSQSDADLIVSLHGPYGAMIRVPDPDDAEETWPEADSGYSPGLLASLRYGGSIGASHVRFDADGPILQDLPTHD